MITTRLWRTCGIALTLALVANFFLGPLTNWDDGFASIVAVASLVAAVALILTRFVAPFHRFTRDALTLSSAVWIANAIEYVFQDFASTESKLRNVGFYLAFAVLSLGMMLIAWREENA